MITCIIVDDEPSAIDVLQIHAEKTPGLKIQESFTDPFKARDYLKSNPADMIFLDINMPGLSGLQLLDELFHRPLVVFTTAYSEYAVDSYDYKAIDYLLKPIEYDRFSRAVKRVEAALDTNNGNGNSKKNFLFLKDGYKQVKVFVDDILFIQSDGNYLNVFMGSKRINTRMTMQQMLELLPESEFRRVHNSYVVNVEQIERIEGSRIFVPRGEISMGPSFKEEFLEFLEHSQKMNK